MNNFPQRTLRSEKGHSLVERALLTESHSPDPLMVHASHRGAFSKTNCCAHSLIMILAANRWASLQRPAVLIRPLKNVSQKSRKSRTRGLAGSFGAIFKLEAPVLQEEMAWMAPAVPRMNMCVATHGKNPLTEILLGLLLAAHGGAAMDLRRVTLIGMHVLKWSHRQFFCSFAAYCYCNHRVCLLKAGYFSLENQTNRACHWEVDLFLVELLILIHSLYFERWNPSQ